MEQKCEIRLSMMSYNLQPIYDKLMQPADDGPKAKAHRSAKLWGHLICPITIGFFSSLATLKQGRNLDFHLLLVLVPQRLSPSTSQFIPS